MIIVRGKTVFFYDSCSRTYMLFKCYSAQVRLITLKSWTVIAIKFKRFSKAVSYPVAEKEVVYSFGPVYWISHSQELRCENANTVVSSSNTRCPSDQKITASLPLLLLFCQSLLLCQMHTLALIQHNTIHNPISRPCHLEPFSL